jgi:hypothetical protein
MAEKIVVPSVLPSKPVTKEVPKTTGMGLDPQRIPVPRGSRAAMNPRRVLVPGLRGAGSWSPSVNSCRARLLFRHTESSVKLSGPIPNRPYGVPTRTHYDCSNFGGPYVDSYSFSPFRHSWSCGVSSYLLLILFESRLARPFGIVC